MQRWLARCLLLLALAAIHPAGLAVDPQLRIDQLHHTAWRAADGAPSDIRALAQTADGFLWIGSTGGLFRFDGARFDTVVAPDRQLRSPAVSALLADPDGGLWVGFAAAGVAHLKDGRFTFVDDGWHAGAQPARLFLDRDGRLWSTSSCGLFRLEGRHWRRLGAADGFSTQASTNVLFDGDGSLWIEAEDGWFFLRHGQDRFVRTTHGLPAVATVDGRGVFWGLDATGSLHASTPATGRALASAPCTVPGGADGRLQFDRHGILWMAGWGSGLARLRDLDAAACRIDRFTERNGLSGDTVESMLEDREGDVWFGTNNGLDRFRNGRVVSAPLATGREVAALAATDDGKVLAANHVHGASLLDADGAAAALGPQGSPRMVSAGRDARGVAWAGGAKAIWRLEGRQLAKVDPPPGIAALAGPSDAIALAGDAAGGLWVDFKPGGLFRHDDKGWSQLPPSLVGTAPHASMADAGSLGMLLAEGDAVRIVHGRQARLLGPAEGLAVGHVMSLFVRRADVWIGGSAGLALWRAERITAIRVAGVPSLRGVSGIVETQDGDLWLNQAAGIVHIAAEELRRAVSDPDHAAAAETLDRLDGLLGSGPGAFPTPSLIEAGDGRLWATTYSGVFWLDPKQRYRNVQRPSATLLGVEVGDRLVAPQQNLALDAGTKQLRFGFTAASLAMPERVRFRFRLGGVDDDWRSTNARNTSYTNLGPGTYTFSVIAANESGLWGTTPATMTFTIPPLFWQTRCFTCLCLLALGCALWLLHRWRLGLHARRVLERTKARISERERIARDLHDTLLQGMQALNWKLQALAAQVPETDRLHVAMEGALSVAQALIEDGRQSVHGLRVPRTRQELSQAIAASIGQLAPDESPALHCAVDGIPRPLRDHAWLEIFRIGCEACSNALRHARASRVSIRVQYLEDALLVQVRDDGIGFAPSGTTAHLQGRHWGLVGMRERALRMGATLSIDSAAGSGTSVRLECPASRAYAMPEAGRRQRRRTAA